MVHALLVEISWVLLEEKCGQFCMTFASQHSVVLVRVCHLVAGAVDLVGSMLHAVLHVLHRILDLQASLADSPSY